MIRFALLAGLLAGCLSEPDPPCQPARNLDELGDHVDQTPWLSDDRDELIFTSSRNSPGFKLFRTTRSAPSEPFSIPSQLADVGVDAFDPFVVGDVLYFIVGDGNSGGTIRAVARRAGDFDLSVASDVFPELGTLLHPTLTSDLKTIVFAKPMDPDPVTSLPRTSLLMMATRPRVDAPFPAPHQIGFFGGVNGSPTISPDGQTLVFDTEHFTSAHKQIARGHRSGDDFVDITHVDLGATQADDLNPYLHPDGRTLVFASDRLDGNAHLFIYCE